MYESIRRQGTWYALYYVIFALLTGGILLYYLSNTIIHFTTDRQFPINSIGRFPLTILILPAELFSFMFALYFVYLLLREKHQEMPTMAGALTSSSVAVLIPVYNEPDEIVDKTVQACTKLTWKGPTRIYILDDSTEEVYKTAMKRVASKYACTRITRADRTGYKAGNINNALRTVVKEPFFVILDADQAPHTDFLKETIPFFEDPTVSFVQTPQYFINESTLIERATKVGMNIFFQAQCATKAQDHALPFCGTNAVIRTSTFLHVGGFMYYTSTEDIELGIRMDHAGYHGVYVAKILCHGTAPQDFNAYATQQYRWANGNLAILRESFFKIIVGGKSLTYMIHTLFTLAWWLVGFVSFLFILIPLLSLFFGWGTHHTWLPTAMIALLYIQVIVGILMIYMSLQKRTSERITIRDALLEYSLITNSMFIYMRAAFNAAIGRYGNFVRTNKVRSRTPLRLVAPNIILGLICFGASVYAVYMAFRFSDITWIRTYLPVSIWLLFYGIILVSSIMFVGGSRDDRVRV